MGGNDLYIAKYEGTTGEVLWAVAGTGTDDDTGNGIAIAEDDAVYICGTFNSTDFAIGTVTVTHSSAGSNNDFFYAKIDHLTGNVLVAENPSLPTINETAKSIAVNNSYGIFIAGFTGSDPDRDPMVVAFDFTGATIGTIDITGDKDDYASGICINFSGQIYVTGSFNSPNLDFPGTTVPSLINSGGGDYDLFLLNINGSIALSLNSALNPSGDGDEIGNSVAVDATGDAYITGCFDGSAITFSGGISLGNSCPVTYMTKDYFTVKISSANIPIWISGGNAGTDWNFDDVGMDVAVNPFGDCYVTGYFKSNEINFGLGTIYNATNNNYAELFVIKYDFFGNPMWNVIPTEVFDEYGYGIAIKNEGQCCAVTGQFNSSSLNIMGTILTNTSSEIEFGDALVFSLCDECDCADVAAQEWYFGEFAGLDFSSPTPVPVSSSNINTEEGCSVIHDAAGNMLFYSDGISIWDNSHTIMPGSGGLYGHSSSTQSAIIVPKPCNDHIYYVFTTGNWGDDQDGFNYSIVDMNLRSGLGDVVPGYSNINLLPRERATEKVTAVTHSNGIDIWIITHEWGSNNFLSYLLTSEGLSVPLVSSIGSIHSSSILNKAGYLKASPDGEYLACAAYYNSIFDFELFGFNTTTGNVNPLLDSFNHSLSHCYGVEFSKCGTKLYVSAFTELLQYNITLEIWTSLGTSTGTYIGAIQRAPNGKIYIARDDVTFLGVINDPCESGLSCDYEEVGILLGGKHSLLGLPACYENKCIDAGFRSDAHLISIGESVQFNNVSRGDINTWSWSFPGGSPSTSNELNPLITYQDMGVYEVSLTVTGPAGNDTETKMAYIHVGTTGIDDMEENFEDLFIYPNPSRGIFNIEVPAKYCRVIVHNIHGQELINQVTEGLKASFDIGNYTKGPYFVTVILPGKEKQYHSKIILQ